MRAECNQYRDTRNPNNTTLSTCVDQRYTMIYNEKQPKKFDHTNAIVFGTDTLSWSMSTATCALCCCSMLRTSSSSWRLLSCVAPLLTLLMLLVLPAAIRLLLSFVMLCLQMGQVLLSFSQGSTHFLWNSCLWREREREPITSLDFNNHYVWEFAVTV